MQAAYVSRNLKLKFERIERDGREQYNLSKGAPDAIDRLVHLVNAEVLFGQAWMIADVAVQVAPTSEYSAWCDRRADAGQNKQTCRDALGSDLRALGNSYQAGVQDALHAEVRALGTSGEACAFERCPEPATRKLGGDVYFPMCQRHAAQVTA